MTFQEIRDKLTIQRGNFERTGKALESHASHHKTLVRERDDLAIAQRYAHDSAQVVLESVAVNINGIVTSAINAILPGRYEFKLEFKIAYGQIACGMYLTKDGKRYNMRSQNGDGVVDLVALALRVAVLCLDRRGLRRVLLLDEPAGCVSVNFQPAVGELIEYMVKELKLQVLMIAAHGSNLDFKTAKIIDTKDFKEGAVL